MTMKLMTYSLVTFAALSSSLWAAVVIDDPFNYTTGSNLGGQGGWANVNMGDEVVLVSGSLNGTLFRPSTGNSITFGGAGTDPQKTFTSQSTSLYFSFLLNISALGTLNTTGGYFAGLGSSSTLFGATLWARSDGATGYNLGINKRTTTADTVYSATSFATGTTLTIVGQYELVSGTLNDTVRLWVNPDPTTFGSTAPTATVTATATQADLTALDRFFFRQDSATATAGTLVIDELRVGDTYAEVTAVPEPSTALSLVLGTGVLLSFRRRRRVAE